MNSARLQQGYALVLVLWVLVLLTSMSLAFSGNVRMESRATLGLTERVRLGAAADGAIAHAIYRISHDEKLAATLAGQAGYTLPWPDVTLQVTMASESAKIDINLAPRPLLIGLFREVLPDARAEALADAVLDWRDRDTRRSPQGAEAADYRAAGLTRLPANRRFTSITEVGAVMGIGPDRLARLWPHITIHSRRPRIDPYSASATVLAAVPGLDRDAASTFVAYRDAQREAGDTIRLDQLAAGIRYLERRPTVSAVNLRVTARDSAGRTVQRAAVVRLTGHAGQHHMLEWQPQVTEAD